MYKEKMSISSSKQEVELFEEYYDAFDVMSNDDLYELTRNWPLERIKALCTSNRNVAQQCREGLMAQHIAELRDWYQIAQDIHNALYLNRKDSLWKSTIGEIDNMLDKEYIDDYPDIYIDYIINTISMEKLYRKAVKFLKIKAKYVKRIDIRSIALILLDNSEGIDRKEKKEYVRYILINLPKSKQYDVRELWTTYMDGVEAQNRNKTSQSAYDPYDDSDAEDEAPARRR